MQKNKQTNKKREGGEGSYRMWWPHFYFRQKSFVYPAKKKFERSL